MTIEQKKSLGRTLAELRTQHNYSQEKLALASGVPLRTLQRAERGDGISKENLDALTLALNTDSTSVLKNAKERESAPPTVRLAMRLLDKPADLLKFFQTKASFQLAPEGEHPFNEQWAETWMEMEDLDDAKVALSFAKNLGFHIFGICYKEEFEHHGKRVRKPVSWLILAPGHDSRIRKTSKGLELDYVMDARKQMFSRMLNFQPTVADWIEEQLISRSDGEARAEFALKEVQKRVRKEVSRG